MGLTQCANGHVYEADIYDTCPYCNSSGLEIDFEKGSHGGGNRTVAPVSGGFGPSAESDGSARSQIGRTEAVVSMSGGTHLGATVAPEGLRGGEDARKTTWVSPTGEQGQQTVVEPVVGWLACIDGAAKGKDFRLVGRQNTIGRDKNMDVCLGDDDMTISRDRHARIAYDPRHNRFTLIPAENTNNIYLNDEPVYESTPIQAYDCIEFGTSKFVLIPLCTDRFTWEKGLVTDAESVT